MSNDSSAIVSKVWHYAHVLKNAGVGYGDYVEVRAARAITYPIQLIASFSHSKRSLLFLIFVI